MAAFFTLYAYVWSIVGLMPVSLALGSFAGVILWWLKLNDQRVLLTFLVIIGMIAAVAQAYSV